MRSVLLDVAMVPTLPLVPKILVLVFQFLKSWALAPSPSHRGPLVSLGNKALFVVFFFPGLGVVGVRVAFPRWAGLT